MPFACPALRFKPWANILCLPALVRIVNGVRISGRGFFLTVG